jgi:hypothetical protein
MNQQARARERAAALDASGEGLFAERQFDDFDRSSENEAIRFEHVSLSRDLSLLVERFESWCDRASNVHTDLKTPTRLIEVRAQVQVDGAGAER